MQILEYNKSSDLLIEFQDEHKHQVKTTYNNFKLGVVKNPYDKTIYGVGYVGIGEYAPSINKTNTRAYSTWVNIMQRCYSETQKSRHEAYWDCTMCDEWFDFQNFAQWYDVNYYEVKGCRMHIDKDILVKDNTIYSADKCLIVPQRINMVFMKKSRTKDPDLPNGIRRVVSGYSATYNTKSLGVYKTLDEAKKAHDTEKRIHIKNLANDFKDQIPVKVYNALLNW